MAHKNEKEEMYSGENMRFAFPIVDEDNQPLDLTGASVIFTLAGITKSTSTSGITINQNIVLVTLECSDTLGMAGLYSYELRVTTDSNDSRVCAVGDIKIIHSKSI